jgi:decaprenylphospho-beta-D-erythro-pentofuranosid-2-ulose 2-reductase
MRNAVGSVQSAVVFGGTSDIGLAIVERLIPRGLRRAVLAGRNAPALATAAAHLRAAGLAEVETVEWDALEPSAHVNAVEAAMGGGDDDHADVDLVLYVAAVLGDQSAFDADPAAAADAVAANFGGAVSTLLAAAAHLRAQGHGTIVVLSSVAGERARRGNYVYGSTKAGLDAFAQGLGDALVESGVQVMVVRPGFVRSKMTEGLEPAPMATTPAAVADAVIEGLARNRETVWVPGTLRVVMSGFRHLPRGVWRRVSARA